MSFQEFVAIRLSQSDNRTIDYKSISSFLDSIKGYDEMDMEELLKVWVIDMIYRGLATTSRKRYVEKLSSIYKEFSHDNNFDRDPFNGLRELYTLSAPANARSHHPDLVKIERIFDVIMTDAISRPELAVFLYLLFNASSDIERAISLTMDEYNSEFHQLDDVIKTTGFHHRRKYVFDLGQSRKRMPQLKREVTEAIDSYLRVKDIRFTEPFTPQTITTLWMAKAHSIGVRLTEIRQVVNSIPTGYNYLRSVKGSVLSADEISSVKRRVAESLYPSGKKWYAVRLHRGTTYDRFKNLVKAYFVESYDDNHIFYPQKEIARHIEKKIVSEIVPVIPDVVFIHINPHHVRKADALIRSEHAGYVFRTSSAVESDYSIIDTRSMTGFQLMIGVFTPDIKVRLTTEAPVGIGRDVVITGGIMSGYEGTIYDIDDDSDVRRLYIRLSEKYSIKAEVRVEAVFVKAVI